MRTIGFFALLLTSLAAPLCGAEESHVRLVYQRTNGAQRCASYGEFRTQLTAKLGYDAITDEEGTRALHVTLTKTPAGFHGALELRNAAGKTLGSRALNSKGNDCAELVSAIAVAAAISIDPSSIARSPDPLPTLPGPALSETTERPVAADLGTRRERSRPIYGGRSYILVDAALLLAMGTEPSPTVGGTLGVGFARNAWSLKAEGRFDASQSTTNVNFNAFPASTTVTSVSSALFGAALVPCYSWSVIRGCATVMLGALAMTGGSTTSFTSSTRFYAGAGPRFEITFPIRSLGGLFLRGELLANFMRADAFVDGAPVWHVPPVSGSLSIGGELHLGGDGR